MHERRHMLPVWFFIGVLLTIYGIIILITAIGEWSHPTAVVLAQYHPGIWCGVLLLVIGIFYTVRFWPRSR
jgi:FtsH-binding integral membrane protein